MAAIVDALIGPLWPFLAAALSAVGLALYGRSKRAEGRKDAEQRQAARAAEQEAARHDRITEAETDGPVTDDDVLDRLRNAEGRLRGNRD